MTAGAAWADDWIEQVPARLAWLDEQVDRRGGPPSSALDLTPESLVPLWAWARRQFRRRPTGTAADPAVLPAWFTDPRAWRPKWWDDDTIWLADALIAYLAQALLHHAAGARWGTGHDEEDPEAYVHEGQPVLLGLAQTDVHLWTGMANTAGLVWSGDDTDDDLARLFEQCTRPAGVP